MRRCLVSVIGLMDEIIIVDTGSTDRTKEVAAEFTDQIYDYEWQDDFAAARNFAFSKATMDYIYTADADEVMDYFNQKRFAELKQALLPEIEIVQMYYITPQAYNTTANFRKEYRPKLYKRLREFVWIDAVHETVRLDPVVYDSDIEIKHLPRSLHADRDFRLFLHVFDREGRLSPKLHSMYVKELFVSGSENDFAEAAPIFGWTLKQQEASVDMKREAICALCHMYRTAGETDKFFSMAFKLMPDACCSELCYEVGCFFKGQEDYEEALQWFGLAAYHSKPVIDVRTGGVFPLLELGECCRMLAASAHTNALDAEDYLKAAKQYEQKAAEWELPAFS